MWTSIGEALGMAPEDRLPPALLAQVSPRSVLLILDNLEQLVAASSVVEQLLTQAPQVVVLATSRHPLHLPAEHEHPVPPLELPGTDDLTGIEASAAVQLFVQQARRVQPRFVLTPANMGDVGAICRRLDGLPLAIELAASRTKLLSPRALLTRLDKALDMADSGHQVPSRHRTLRDTMAWSYDLLAPAQRVFFRRLGVFVGGADLGAIGAVAAADFGADGEDPLDLVTGLLDASLVTITETFDGEPRISLLETVRAYALDQLTANDELDPVRERHAHHYLGVLEEKSPLADTHRYWEARSWFETEEDNLRAALDWALPKEEPLPPDDRAQTGLWLCSAMCDYWEASSLPYSDNPWHWLERAVERADGRDSPELARCLQTRSVLQSIDGDIEGAHATATASTCMWRRLDEPDRLAGALITLAWTEVTRGDHAAARLLLEEASALARAADCLRYVAGALRELANLEHIEHNYQRALELNTEAVSVANHIGNPTTSLLAQHNMACDLLRLGRVQDAHQLMRSLVPQHLKLDLGPFLVAIAEDYAAVLVEVGLGHQAVHLIGAADAKREREDHHRDQTQQTEVADTLARARAALSTQEWDTSYEAGRGTAIRDALTEAYTADAQSQGPPANRLPSLSP